MIKWHGSAVVPVSKLPLIHLWCRYVYMLHGEPMVQHTRQMVIASVCVKSSIIVV